MNKLKLNWEELVVESFETVAADDARGTVRGNASYIHDGCLTETDELSCPGSCEPATCYEGCGGGTYTCPPSPTRDITCKQTAPAPETCCQLTC